MKLKVYSMLAASLLLLGSCAEQEEMGTPIQTGDEIHFGLSTPGEVKTRTIYGTPVDNGDGTGYFPIYWEQDDEIAIYCPQAIQPETQLVHYKITPDPNDKSTSSAVTRVGDVGLQWGDRDKEHRFYGFYPASAVKGTETDGRIISEIPVFQAVKKWEDNGKAVGQGKVYTGIPDTKFAYMFAYTAVTPSSLTAENADIPLKFNPLVTILEVEVNGPKSGSSVKVTNINVTSSDGTALAGNFECLISDRSGTCTPVNDATVTNRVSVSCYDNDKDKFIELGVGDKLKVKLFLLPYTDHNIQQGSLKVTVSTLNGAAKTKTLQTADVVSQRVNRVSLPALNANGDTNYWMSSLDPNIYVSELSIPGSKFSVLTSQNGASPVYQNATIEKQFQDGVRAFILQTATCTDWGSYDDVYVVCDSKDRKIMRLSEAISDISTYLANLPEGKKNEFAFVMLTYLAGDVPWLSGEDKERYWLDRLNYEVNEMLKYPKTYRIYNGVINNNTTIADVAGKIILKVNYNSENMIRQYNGSAPMLFSYWGGYYGPMNDDEKTYYQDSNNGMPMDWKTPVWYLNNKSAGLRWYYQEVTHVGDGAEATKEQKETFIKELFSKSVDMYHNDVEHKTWFMNDLGGRYTSSNNTTQLATDMNNLGVKELQNRPENAGLGLVFMNFADKQNGSGTEYKSDWLIQTLIDNNFKFALRKKESSSTGTKSVSHIVSDEDGWDN